LLACNAGVRRDFEIYEVGVKKNIYSRIGERAPTMFDIFDGVYVRPCKICGVIAYVSHKWLVLRSGTSYNLDIL